LSSCESGWGGSRTSRRVRRSPLKVLEISTRTLGAEHPDTLDAKYLLADTAQSRGNPAQAEILFTNVWESRRKKLGPQNPQTLDALASLGGARLAEKKYASAEVASREALAPDEKAGISGVRRDASQSMLGASLAGQGKYGEAEPLLLSGYAGLLGREATMTVHDRVDLDRAGRDWSNFTRAGAGQIRRLSGNKSCRKPDLPGLANRLKRR
jgi:hypothetical protein